MTPRSVALAWDSRAARVLALLTVLVLAALAFLTRRDHTGGTGEPPATRLVSDCDGAITDWLLGLPDENAAFFEDTQADLVASADPRIRFHLYYAHDERRRRFEQALSRRGNADPTRVHWHKSPRRVWPWMRDLFLAATTARDEPVILSHHSGHYGRWPRAWDVDGVRALAATLEGGRFTETTARIDGGAIVVDADRVLVSGAFVDEALRRGDSSSASDLLARLRVPWGLPIQPIAVQEAHRTRHCDLVMMPAGNRRIVVASPALGASVLASIGADERRRFAQAFRRIALRTPGRRAPGGEDHDVLGAMHARNSRPLVQRGFTRVRLRLEALGYAVAEIPQLGLTPSDGGIDAAFSYVNVVIDERAGRRTVYMPTFRLPTLDRRAAEVWERLGYRVVPIDALAPGLQGGALHCLSQVFRARPMAAKGVPGA